VKRPKIAIYVQHRYDKKTYKVESYRVRIWAGIELVKHDLELNGYKVDYCDMGTVTDYDIVMVSMTSYCDWFSFIAERVQWEKGNYKVLVGGAGFTNVRPFLEYFDAGVFGRAEGFTAKVIESLVGGYELDQPQVVYSRSFSPLKAYALRQVDRPYPHEFINARGQNCTETAIGCKLRCLFCDFSWGRKFVTNDQDIKGEYNTANNTTEGTIFDFDLDHPEEWTKDGSYMIAGIDGFSERLRYMANKPIKNDRLRDFIIGSVQAPSVYIVKLFNIVGYPTETSEDWKELVEVVKEADSLITKKCDDREFFLIQVTSNHFKPGPVTPFAVVPTRYENLRWLPADTVRQHPLDNPQYRHKIFDGKHLRLLFMQSTEALPQVTLNQLSVRGTEEDAEVLRKIAVSRGYWNASTKKRITTLERYLDVDRLFGTYTWEKLPTRYLHGMTSYDKMARVLDTRLRKHGGAEGAKIANNVMGVA
tara:strand:+ start:1189 stop:2616 length:1428 start_codon:yes stop_codon:yes gene_type:complete